MPKCLHLSIVFALWGIGVVTSQLARGQTVAATEKPNEQAEHGIEIIEVLNSIRHDAIEKKSMNGLPNDHDVILPMLIAAPQNLNPGLYEQLPLLPTSPVPNATPTDGVNSPLESGEPSFVDPIGPAPLDETLPQVHVPFIEWEALEIDISDNLSNFGQGNRILTPIFRGHLANGDTISFSPGFNQFVLPNIESVSHIPVTIAWERAINDVVLVVGGGLDTYNRLPFDTHFNTQASTPIGNGATLALSVEQGPYLFNAQTLENGISSWRYGPDLFWQIDPKTTLFALARIGHFNDGNFEQQSFSRLERELWGDAAISANLFNWSFQRDLETTSGYFSPPDFLVASLEVSWEKEIIDDISCRLAASVAQQRLNGSWTLGYGHQALCALDLIPGIAFDFGYNFSNVGDGQMFLFEESAYNTFEWVGGIKTNF